MVYVTDVAWIWHCCGYGAGQQLQLQFDPLAWKLPYTMGVALKRPKKKKTKNKNKSAYWLPKILVNLQVTLNTPLDMVLPTRGTRSSSKHK